MQCPRRLAQNERVISIADDNLSAFARDQTRRIDPLERLHANAPAQNLRDHIELRMIVQRNRLASPQTKHARMKRRIGREHILAKPMIGNRKGENPLKLGLIDTKIEG